MIMNAGHTLKFIGFDVVLFPSTSVPPKFVPRSSYRASFLLRCPLYPEISPSLPRRNSPNLVLAKSSEAEELSDTEDEWLKRLPEKNKPLYSHSLPCIEAWLRNLGFYQSKDDRAVWLVQKPDWHAQLSLDVTDLYIRYLKSGPGNLERDIERRFNYALSREDVENAILGGP